jgi:hypothetical protein
MAKIPTDVERSITIRVPTARACAHLRDVVGSSRYEGNGTDTITFTGIAAKGENTDVSGRIVLRASGTDATHVVLRQRLAPDTPVPRLLHGLVHSFVEKEAADGVHRYLAGVKRALERGGTGS